MNSVILREDDDADGQTIEDNIDVEAPLHDLPCLNPLVVNDLLDGVLLVDGLVQISKLEEQLRQVNVIEVQPLLEPAADFLTDDQRGEVDVGVLHLNRIDFLLSLFLLLHIPLLNFADDLILDIMD